MTGQPLFRIKLIPFIALAYFFLLMFHLLLFLPANVSGCPFCPPVSATLTEQFEESPIVILAEFDSVVKNGEREETFFNPLKIEKGNENLFKADEKIKVDEKYQGRKGDLFLLFSAKEGLGVWNDIIPVSETSFQYMIQAPGLESEKKKRLTYFLRFLEFPDPIIANDAFSEFAQASFADVSSLSDKYPVEKLRKWLQESDMPATRIGLYALMLGLSGNENDIALFKHKMEKLDDEFHLGLDGLIAGYILLSGNEGFKYLNQKYLTKENASSSESFAAMKALRFLHQYAKNQIDSKQVEASMRLLLNRPAMTELVIIDLSRWKDWSVANELMEIYTQPMHDNRPTKRAILSYLLLFQEVQIEKNKQSVKKNSNVNSFLIQAKKKNPRVYHEAERVLNRK